MTRRAPPLWRVIAPTLVGAALVSMLAIAAVNYVVTSDLDREQSLEQLGELQRSRSQAIDEGLELRRQSVAILAADRSVVGALVDLRDATALLDDPDTTGTTGTTDVTGTTDAERTDALEQNARRLVDDPALRSVVAATGLEIPTVAQLVPDDPAARYLQYHYTLAGSRDERLALDDPGDGSRYSERHAEHHPVLRQLALDAGFQDLMLVSLAGNRTVYTATKGPDFGVDIIGSVFGSGGFGTEVADVLPRTSTGEAVLLDVQPYLGAGGRPVLFVAAAVRDDLEIVGALIVQVPIDRLNRLMTADRQWVDAGLGETGQTYLVGRDLRLRSDARTYLEDPEAHVAALRTSGSGAGTAAGPDADTVADAVMAAGSTVFTQPIDTAAVRSALDGSTFSGATTGATGTTTLTVASPLGVSGLDWVVVAEIDRSEAMAESRRQLTTLLVLAAILLPAVALIGLYLARRLVRPVRPLVEAAERTAAGRRDLDRDELDELDGHELDQWSRDEYGHLARELRRYAEMLADDDARLDDERRALDELFLAVLPARVIDAVRSGDLELGDLVDTATVIAVSIDGVTDTSDDPWATERFTAVSADLEELATRHHVERVWSSADRHLYVAGLGLDHHGCDDAMRFVSDAREVLADDLPDHGVTVTAAVAAGTVTTGVVGGDQLAFGMWGEPTRLALALAAVGEAGQVIVHDTVSERLEVAGLLDGVRFRVDPGDGPIEVARLRDRAAMS